MPKEISREYVAEKAPGILRDFPRAFYELHAVGGGLVITRPDGEALVRPELPAVPGTPEVTRTKSNTWVV